MWSRRCDTAEICDVRIWRVGIARNVVFFHSFVAGCLGKPGPKNGRRANFGDFNFQKCSDTVSFERFWLPNCSRAQAGCKFWWHQFPKVLRTSQLLTILTSKSLSCAGGVQILVTLSSKRIPNLPVFNDFDVQIALARRCGANFAASSAASPPHPARESDLDVKIVKNWQVRCTFGSWSPQRLRARTIWKSKSLKTEGAGTLLEVEVAKMCTTPARESDSEAKTVKTPGRRDVFWRSKWVQSPFRVAGAGISTQHLHKNC